MQHELIRARSWLFPPATRSERFAKAAEARAGAASVNLEAESRPVDYVNDARQGRKVDHRRAIDRGQGEGLANCRSAGRAGDTTHRYQLRHRRVRSGQPQGLSSTERAHALIALTHPEFRDELKVPATAMHLV